MWKGLLDTNIFVEINKIIVFIEISIINKLKITIIEVYDNY